MIPDIDVRVRFCETDAAGHVNNVSYYIYMEEARIRFFEFAELYRYQEEVDPDMSFIVASTHCNYHRQAYARQHLRIGTRLTRIGTKSVTLEHDITDANTGDRIASGGAVVVLFNRRLQRSMEIPGPLRSALERYLSVSVSGGGHEAECRTGCTS